MNKNCPVFIGRYRWIEVRETVQSGLKLQQSTFFNLILAMRKDVSPDSTTVTLDNLGYMWYKNWHEERKLLTDAEKAKFGITDNTKSELT